jgi:hypothetical protein
MVDYLPAALISWLLSAALQTIMHIYCRQLPRLIRYILGTIALCLGSTAASIMLDNLPLGVFPWIIASSGVVTIGLYWGEGQFKRAEAGGQTTTDAAAIARKLKQELEGSRDAQSRMGGTERLN